MRAARRLSLAADRLFKDVIAMHDLTREQLDQLARRYFENALDEDEAQRLTPAQAPSRRFLRNDFQE